MRFFRRRKSVVERIEAWTVVVTPPPADVDPRELATRLTQELKRHQVPSPGERQYTAVMFPTSVEGCLLAEQFEHQLHRRGLA